MRRIKHRIGAFLLAMLVCLSLVIPVYADTEGFAEEYYRLNDMAELLSDNEDQELQTRLDEVSQRQKFDVTITTTWDLEGFSVKDYADTFYENCKFGYGSNHDGIMLLISMEDRDCYITTEGYGIQAFTDAGIDYIIDQITQDLSDEDYAAAFQTFVNLCDNFITQARDGQPYDSSSLPKEPMSWIYIPVCIGIGLVLALVVVGGMKMGMKSVRNQTAAGSYVKDGSLNITESRDMFLYHTVTRTEKPKEKEGGSSTHTSSSGREHGGGGGKF